MHGPSKKEKEKGDSAFKIIMPRNDFCFQPRWGNTNGMNSFTKNNFKIHKTIVCKTSDVRQRRAVITKFRNHEVSSTIDPAYNLEKVSRLWWRKKRPRHRLVTGETELGGKGSQRGRGSQKERAAQRRNSSYAQLPH